MAAAGSTVLYVGLVGPRGDGKGPGGPGNPIGVFLGISRDGADTWEQLRVHSGAVDGPKVAIARDGSRALIVWLEDIGLYRRTRYAILDHPGAPEILLPAPHTLDEELGWEPPNPGSRGHVRECVPRHRDPELRFRQSFVEGHPIGAIGPTGTLYIARVHQYLNFRVRACHPEPFGVPDPRRELEVFRFTEPKGPGSGGFWERILSAPAPDWIEQLQAADGETTDSSTRPAITVVPDGENDAVILATLRRLLDRQTVEITRISNANTCTTTSLYREGCASVESFRIDERIRYEFGQLTLEADDPPFHAAFQPVLFAGDSTTRPFADGRVGLFYYWQPYFFDPAASPFERAITTVVGLTSDDGGASWRVPQLPGTVITRGVGETLGYELTVPVTGRRSVYSDPRLLRSGEVFHPCGAPGSGYFGHYNGGAFQTDEPSERQAVAAWADSREDFCVRPPTWWDTTPQHVYSSRYPTLTIAP